MCLTACLKQHQVSPRYLAALHRFRRYRFRIQQLAVEATVELYDHLRLLEGEVPRLHAEGVVLHIVYLYDAVRRLPSQVRRHLIGKVGGPADVDLAPEGIVFSRFGSVPFGTGSMVF